MSNKNAKYLVEAALIAALYAVLTLVIAPIGFGGNQIRVSEALNVLVFFTPAAVPGLFAGCVLANLASPFGIIDIAVGSLATLLAGFIASKMKNRFLVGLPSVAVNALMVPLVLKFVAGIPYWLGVVSVGLGQFLSLYLLGLPLLLFLDRNVALKRLLEG